MLKKMYMSEEELDYVAKGIAIGVSCGIIAGVIGGEMILGFSAGGVVGILGAFGYSAYKKIKSIEKKQLV
ncbi:hypothetical protein [Clostridium sp.]|uniref:hypothetical protein n=1 Tax=Clostridium sp. TaxID=1506 RepID=UPI003F33AE88